MTGGPKSHKIVKHEQFGSQLWSIILITNLASDVCMDNYDLDSGGLEHTNKSVPEGRTPTEIA